MNPRRLIDIRYNEKKGHLVHAVYKLYHTRNGAFVSIYILKEAYICIFMFSLEYNTKHICMCLMLNLLISNKFYNTFYSIIYVCT